MQITVNIHVTIPRLLERLDELERKIMANLQQLQAAVDQAAADAKDNAAAVTAEIARIEALIASLGNSGIDPTLLDPIVAQLTDISASLKTTTAAATGERA
jgi:hypothetical protein